MDLVLGHGIIHLVVLRKFPGVRLAPPFGQEIVEEPRIAAHDPERARPCFRMANDIGHARVSRPQQGGRQFGGGETVALVVEIRVAARPVAPLLHAPACGSGVRSR